MIGSRIEERLATLGLTQSELARRVSLSQSTINGLIRGTARSSAHLHRIARELRTTPAFLSGEIDDPNEGAPPPPPAPRNQLVTMSVSFPSEEVLTQLFGAVLLASPRLKGDALARELAKRLPTLLAVGRLPMTELAQDLDDIGAVQSPVRDDDQPERRRALRK